jgi:hypothetical protein
MPYHPVKLAAGKLPNVIELLAPYLNWHAAIPPLQTSKVGSVTEKLLISNILEPV